MKNFFRGHHLVVLSVLLGMLFAAAVSVYASTTIGTDINTEGTLTVGPPVSSLTPILNGYLGPSSALVTGDMTDNSSVGLGVEVQNVNDNSNSLTGVYSVVVGTALSSAIQGDILASSDTSINNAIVAGGSTNGHNVGQINMFYAYQPGIFEGSTLTTDVSYWSNDLSGGATNSYYSWFDSRGVRRVKEDSTFNSVGQAIEALYNPQFTKYTPGATDYERVVLGQWNSNVAEIGTQAGGTGTLRSLRLLGTAVNIVPVATASLPTCTEGSIKPVTDSNTNTWGATIAGGGSNHVLAYCDGTNWTVMAK